MSIISGKGRCGSLQGSAHLITSLLFKCFDLIDRALVAGGDDRHAGNIIGVRSHLRQGYAMLKPLLIKRPDIWERTPSLFSTSTEKYLSSCVLLISYYRLSTRRP